MTRVAWKAIFGDYSHNQEIGNCVLKQQAGQKHPTLKTTDRSMAITTIMHIILMDFGV